MKVIQLMSLIPDRDCTLRSDLQSMKLGVIDCNRLKGIVVDIDEYDSVLKALAQKGWVKVRGERGGPEGVSVAFLDNPAVPRTPPRMSEETKKYLANRNP